MVGKENKTIKNKQQALKLLRASPYASLDPAVIIKNVKKDALHPVRVRKIEMSRPCHLQLDVETTLHHEYSRDGPH